jgi:hypothetical protein
MVCVPVHAALLLCLRRAVTTDHVAPELHGAVSSGDTCTLTAALSNSCVAQHPVSCVIYHVCMFDCVHFLYIGAGPPESAKST